MADGRGKSLRWRMRCLYALFVMAILYAQLLPLQTMPRSWAGPDLIVVLTVSWALRRPDYVPALLVAIMTLLADFILLRPPGAMAAVMVTARQTLKRQEPGLRDSTFLAEWSTAALVMGGIALANGLILAIFLVDTPQIGMTAMQLAMNVAVYPLVALMSHYLMGVRKIVPGETDAMAGTA